MLTNGNIPEISRITEFIRGGTLQIYGENISKDTIDSASAVYVWFPEGTGEETLPGRAVMPETPPDSSLILKFDTVFNQVGYTAPSNLTKTGVAIVWVKNKYGISKPFRVNHPRIFNQSHITALRGDLIQFAGSCLGSVMDNSIYGRRNKTLLLCSCDTGREFYIMNSSDKNYTYNREAYVSEFIIPENVPDGDYEAYLHNGSGGEYGWSEPVRLNIHSGETLVEYFNNKWGDTVKRQRAVPECETVVLRADISGTETDMTNALQTAIDSLKDGGIVRLTAGIYAVSKTIVVKPGVVLKGAGSGNTIIKVCDGILHTQDWNDVVFASRHNGMARWAVDWKERMLAETPAALIRLTTRCGIEDIGIEMGGGADIGILIADINSAEAEKVFINNVKVDGKYKNVYNDGDYHASICAALCSVVSNTDLTVYNSTFKALSPLNLLPARNRRVKLINNVFECSPAQVYESNAKGLVDSLIIGNVFSNGRRSLLMQDGCSNNFFCQNRSVGVSRSGNAQEQYMSEHGMSIWHGCPSGAGDDYIIIDKLEEKSGGETFAQRLEEYDNYLCVMDGRGFGQYRKVIGNDGDKVLIDRPWDVVPDSNTLLTLVQATCNNIWLNNNTEDGNGPTQFVWGGGLDNVIQGHEVVLSYALTFHSYGCCKTDARENPNQKCELHAVAFNRLIGCQVKASGMGLRTDATAIREEHSDEFLPRFKRTYGLFGNVFQANAFEGSKGMCYLKNQQMWIEESYNSGIEIGGAYNLVERNYVAGYANAVKLRYDCEGNYFAKNQFLYCDNKFVFEARGNKFDGCDDRIAGPDSEKLWWY